MRFRTQLSSHANKMMSKKLWSTCESGVHKALQCFAQIRTLKTFFFSRKLNTTQHKHSFTLACRSATRVLTSFAFKTHRTRANLTHTDTQKYIQTYINTVRMNQKRDESRKAGQREIYNQRHQKQVHYGGR